MKSKYIALTSKYIALTSSLAGPETNPNPNPRHLIVQSIYGLTSNKLQKKLF